MRLIDADELIKKLVDNGWIKMDTIKDSVEMIAVQAAIDAAQTVDPVKHGKWIDCSISGGYTCSECLHTMYCCDVKEPSELPKYCSDCGAKMDL